MQAGAFRIGDTAGTLENIVSCKLYRPGSVGFVSKSGGLSNECYNVLSRVTDGLYEGAHYLVQSQMGRAAKPVVSCRDCVKTACSWAVGQVVYYAKGSSI